MNEAQPRVRANDWGTLQPPLVGVYSPTRSVSVVIPAYGAPEKLACTLASLAVQSYPDHLLEVIVVDDQTEPPLRLPEIRPTHTKLVATTTGFGPAHAFSEGVRHADGDVLHRLDSDMLVFRQHVEAQMRWHHLLDYAVVLGHKLFIDPDMSRLSPEIVAAAVRNDAAQNLFEGLPATPHIWIEEVCNRTDDLRTAGWSAYSVHVGATGSVGRDLYVDAGGMDLTLTQGEDIELGYRLAQAGGVFIPEREARSWHLGPTQIMQREDEVNRFNAPFLTDRISQLRWRRNRPGRTYSVPFLEVVLDVVGQTYEAVRGTIDSVLGSSLSDLRCILVGPWSSVSERSRRPIDATNRDVRMLAAAYGGDGRVQFAETKPLDSFPAAFRMELPAGWQVAPTSIDSVLREMEREQHGVRRILLADGETATIIRTAAARRAARVACHEEDPIDVLDAVYGSWWSAGEDDDFRHFLDV
jgi:glycosyltransferase involved in cell wall biosynthesis